MNAKSSLVTHISKLIPRRAPRPSDTFWVAGVVLALLAGSAGLALGQSGIPNVINYQGKLTDSLGNPVTAGPYEVTFKIWNSLSGSTDADYIWGRSFPVNVVTNGLFNVLLTDGVMVGNPKTNQLLCAFEGDQRYLGLTITKALNNTVSPQVEISPRQRLASAPFAIHAYNASYAGQASNSTTAANAAFASYANYSTNAGKFANFSTNDFLMLNKSAQTLTGSLTISNGTLTLRSNLVVSGSVTNSSNLTVGGNMTVSGRVTNSSTLTVSSNLMVSGKVGIGVTSMHSPNPGLLEIESGTNNTPALRLSSAGTGHGSGVWLENRAGAGNSTNTWAIYSHSSDGDLEFRHMERDLVAVSIQTNLMVSFANKPLVIRRYTVPSIPTGQATNQWYTCTNYPHSDWSAVIAGFTMAADIHEGSYGRFIECRMRKAIDSSGYWAIVVDLNDDGTGGVKDIYVDVMFIYRGFTDDPTSRN